MVGVVIKYFHENYGGMLQALATIHILEEYGIEYELIRYQKEQNLKKMVCSIPRLFNRVLMNDKKEALIKAIGKITHLKFREQDRMRHREFALFNQKHFIKLSEIYVGYNALCNAAEKYDAIITGSDQLWSPAGLPTNFYNLMFVPKKVRKVSLASSFGTANIPWYQKKRTAEYLRRIEFISMREDRGSEIVKELIGRDVPTILDPVFFFDRQGWEQLIPVQKELAEDYIFAYFLGDNVEYRKKVQEFAGKRGMKIVALRHLDQYISSDEEFGDIAPYDVDPGKFLNLIRYASYVCTDSFHGACLSIIHQKKFMVFDRYSNSRVSKNSRIDTLCNTFNLKERRFKGVVDLIEDPIDYEAVNMKLHEMREKSVSYINTALGDYMMNSSGVEE